MIWIDVDSFAKIYKLDKQFRWNQNYVKLRRWKIVWSISFCLKNEGKDNVLINILSRCTSGLRDRHRASSWLSSDNISVTTFELIKFLYPWMIQSLSHEFVLNVIIPNINVIFIDKSPCLGMRTTYYILHKLSYKCQFQLFCDERRLCRVPSAASSTSCSTQWREGAHTRTLFLSPLLEDFFEKKTNSGRELRAKQHKLHLLYLCLLLYLAWPPRKEELF